MLARREVSWEGGIAATGVTAALDVSAGGNGQAALLAPLGRGPCCCQRNVFLA